MKTRQTRTDNEQRRFPSALRRVTGTWLMALASHTPVGPGSLATGQAAAAKRRPACACPESTAGANAQRSYMEFAAPLRQVFWI